MKEKGKERDRRKEGARRKEGDSFLRKTFYMALTLLLAASCICGSMFCVRRLLEEKEERLLSEKGAIGQPIAAVNDGENEKEVLSASEIQTIMENWVVSAPYVGEPVEGQITMNDAVKAVDRWLPKMGIFDGIFSGNSTIRSVLYYAVNEKAAEKESDPRCSCWVVQVSNEEMEGRFCVNGTTGQVWQASVTLYEGDMELAAPQLLENFTRFAGLELETAEMEQMEPGETEETAVPDATTMVTAAGDGEVEQESGGYVDAEQWEYEDDDVKRMGRRAPVADTEIMAVVNVYVYGEKYRKMMIGSDAANSKVAVESHVPKYTFSFWLEV